MHYVIALITAVAGLLFALNRLQSAGLDLNAFNPFLWYRRAQWRKKYASKPLYGLQHPMDVAASLMLATAKCEGEISSVQKRHILAMYKGEFHIPQEEATALFVASSFLLKDELSIVDQLDNVLARSRGRFTPEQVDSTLQLMERVARIDGPENREQLRLIERTSELLHPGERGSRKWD